MHDPEPTLRFATRQQRARARHGVLPVEPGHDIGTRPDITKPTQGPAPLRSQDSSRRRLPGQSRTCVALPRWQIRRNRIAEAQRQRWRAYRERIPAV
jgi:hypothetical protein